MKVEPWMRCRLLARANSLHRKPTVSEKETEYISLKLTQFDYLITIKNISELSL